MNIQRNINLKNKNTFGIDIFTKYFTEIEDVEQLKNVLSSTVAINNRIFVLGGGSNILFTNDFDGLVIHNKIKSIKLIDSTAEYAIIEAGAGEEWHHFVEYCVNNDYYGLENLALIPGTVGAAPVQNIGAYGVEQKDFFHSLKGIDLETNQIKEMYLGDCRFLYRNSIFKKELKDKFIITSVKYKLSRIPVLNIQYKELAEELVKSGIYNPNSRNIFDTVCRLRLRKLPNPAEIGNAGSFFKNPEISKDKFDEIKNSYPDIPLYKISENVVKIPAAWLIEQCGWKGKRIGNSGIYEKHALILVNFGGATGNEILNIVRQITESVYSKFSIDLEKEVNVIMV